MSSLTVPNTEQVVAAAVALAAEYGLHCKNPEVLHAAGQVWVHLRPHPVVAQAPKDVLVVRSLAGAATRLANDVQICGWLAQQGLPVAAPSGLIDPGPHQHNGLPVAFYRHYQRDPFRDDQAAGRALRLLHDALPAYGGVLARNETLLSEPRRIIGQLQAGRVLKPAELQLLREHIDAAELRLGNTELVPSHGDVHLGNVLWTTSGPLWTDWEDACLAPPLWDLACLVTSTALYGVPAARLDAALRGYGAKLTPAALKPLVQLRVVQVSAWAATRSAWDPRAAKRLADGLHWLRYHHL